MIDHHLNGTLLKEEEEENLKIAKMYSRYWDFLWG